jgi:hypothetical protein
MAVATLLAGGVSVSMISSPLGSDAMVADERGLLIHVNGIIPVTEIYPFSTVEPIIIRHSTVDVDLSALKIHENDSIASLPHNSSWGYDISSLEFFRNARRWPIDMIIKVNLDGPLDVCCGKIAAVFDAYQTARLAMSYPPQTALPHWFHAQISPLEYSHIFRRDMQDHPLEGPTRTSPPVAITRNLVKKARSLV